MVKVENQYTTANAKRGNKEDTVIRHLQLVDEDGNFTNALPKHMRQWGLDNAGRGHHVVSIIGSQSTGKSTLLNELFGTCFDVMDPKKRGRTTKGIWMSRAKGMSSLALDLEGADSFDRDEDTGFESKSTLFALAISDVMILNLRENQIGLRAGAGFELLKTVFEVNLQLFQGSLAKHKTLLMIIIRDYGNETPLEDLKKILDKTFERIWSKLPKILRTARYMTILMLSISLDPTEKMLYQNLKRKLRDSVIDPNDENYIFRPCYFKCSTADTYDTNLSNIWELIWTNKDLDLATKRVSISESRCEEILENTLADFKQKIQGVKHSLQNDEIIQDQGEQLKSYLNDAMGTYDHIASYYDQRVYQEKREALLEKINSERQTCFGLHLKNLRRKAINKFKDERRAVLSQDSYDFNRALTTCFDDCNHYFNTYSKVDSMQDSNQYELFINELNTERRAYEQEEKRRQQREQEEKRRQQREQEHIEQKSTAVRNAAVGGAIAGATSVVLVVGGIAAVVVAKNPAPIVRIAKEIVEKAVL